MDQVKFKTIKSQVEHCLEAFPYTRNSDVDLTLKLWLEFYGEHLLHRLNDDGKKLWFAEFSAIRFLPREDHVKRIRASFNQKGLYLPTIWEVAQKRGINETQWRRALGYHVENSGQLKFA